MSVQTVDKGLNDNEIMIEKSINSTLENCKYYSNIVKNDVKNVKIINKNAENKNFENIKTRKSVEEEKMTAWVKALFTIYPSIPNIVSVILPVLQPNNLAVKICPPSCKMIVRKNITISK